MALFSNTRFDSMEDLFVEQLEDLYDAEKQLTKALPKMAKAASNGRLRSAFESHLEETRGHVGRLEEVFELVNRKAKATTCEAMKGLIEEGENMIDAKGDDEVRDAALIAAAQRVEHYEIAGYGTIRNFARRLGLEEAAQILQQTLDEEGAADKKLTQLAEQAVNQRAAAASGGAGGARLL